MTDSVRIAKPRVLENLSYEQSGVIEASAGTGKTYTIEHMVVDLILEEDAPISKILVVTFTERATEELVTRVRGILKKTLLADEDDLSDPNDPHWVIDEEGRDRLRKALLAFDRAPVYTIHGFCNRILSQHAFPNRRPFEQEQIDANVLFERVFPEVLREVLAQDSEFAPALRAYISDNSLDDLKDRIYKSTGTWEEIRPNIEDEDIRELDESLRSFERGFDAAADRVEEALENGDVHGNSEDKVSRVLRDFRVAMKDYRENPSLWTFLGTLRRVTDDSPLDYFVNGKGNKDWMPDSLVESLRPFCENEFDAEAVVVNQFAREVEDRLKQEKNEKGVYTYDDMLEMVAEGLTGPGSDELIQTLRSEFEYAIIDEFQDTDPRQWDIFRRLFYESGSTNPCFLIGDPKQAIYGFRGADVNKYRDARETIVKDSDDENIFSLDTNYRSTPDLIEAYNKILRPDETGSFFSEDGTNSYDDPVNPGFTEKWFGRGEAETDVPSIVVPSLFAQGEEGVKARSFERMLGNYYADEIEKLLSEDFYISNNQGDQSRQLTGNDIFVLVNKSKEAELMGDYLDSRNIPYSFYKEEGLFQSSEARYLFEVLQASLNPGDRSRRLMAWHTPFFDVDLRELSKIDRITNEDHSLFQRLLEWNELAESGRVGRLVHSILHDSGILRRSLFKYPGERAFSNYQQLGDRLNQWWQQESLSPEELTARLGRFVRGDHKPGEEEDDTKHIESDRSCVQLMTMHKAKGLQAPVVFLYGGWGRKDEPPYTFYPEDSDRVKYFGSISGSYYNKIRQYQREEDERLLYVAMTRAAGQLYLPFVKEENRGSYVGGRISVLFERLSDFLDNNGDGDSLQDDPRFEVTQPDVSDTLPPISEPVQPSGTTLETPEQIEDWGEVSFEEYRATNQLFIESYSSISRLRESSSDQDEDQVFWGEKEPLAISEEPEERTLPAGRTFGLFVHKMMEELYFGRVEKYRQNGGFEDWVEDPEVEALFDSIVLQYDIERSPKQGIFRLLWRSLTRSIALNDNDIEALSAVPQFDKEKEFWLPIPEEDHPEEGELKEFEFFKGEEASSQSTFPPYRTDKGYIRGFIDLVFEWNDRIYVADWKTDSFDRPEDYHPENLEDYVQEHYEPQLYFYSCALARLINRSGGELERQFGGLFYFFVRGLSLEQRQSNEGAYFYRPEPGDLDIVVEETRQLVNEGIHTRQESIRCG